MGCGGSAATKYDAGSKGTGGAKEAQSATIITDYLAKEDAKKEDHGQGFDRQKFAGANHGGFKQLHENYKITKKLGEGSFGTVQLATSMATQDNRAIKNILKKKLPDVKRFAAEIEIHRSLDHPNVVKLYEIYEDARCMYLVMEYCTGGELFDRIVNAGSFDESQAALLLAQMLRAVAYLHGMDICHRDLKPENFLLENEKPVDHPENMVKIIDFGVSRRYTPGQAMKTRVCTPYYVAPEVVNGKYNELCDMWSMGVILYILLSGTPPFYGQGDEEIIKNVTRGVYYCEEYPWPDVSDSAKDLIAKLLVKSLDKRLSANAALEHPWLTNKDKTNKAVISEAALRNLKTFRAKNKLKKAALTVIAGEVGGKALMDLKNTFLSLDTDNSGVLSMDEIQAGLKEAGFTNIPDELQKVMDSVDADGSGKIDYTEFIAASMSQREYLQEEVCWKAFRVFDKDGNGVITPEELRDVLGSESKEMEASFSRNTDEIMQIINDCDTDGDGCINFEEFLAMMKKEDDLSGRKKSILDGTNLAELPGY
jgi:calcium-dependent protein kinase